MSKIAILGIDGLDPLLVQKWRDILPNISGLYKDQSEIMTESTFPPDSICAWTSIYTGENPAEHGLLESIDYLANKRLTENEDRSVVFRGKTFWDIAGRNGKTVCVINPFLAYPAWDVNGIMVSGPVFEGGEIKACPESILSEYEFPPIGGIVDFPDEKNLGLFLLNTKRSTEELAEVSLNIYKDKKPDLFFLAFLTLDRIKHFLWRFTDNDDPYYPGETDYKNSIKDFYVLFDKIIGKFKDSLADDTCLMIISDHGHRRRCSKCLNLNEILRKSGFISISGSGLKGFLKSSVERAKIFTIAALSQCGLQDWIYKIAKFIPNRKALKKSTYLFNKESSAVSLSNICGTNPFGGIDIKAETKEGYEVLRDRVIKELWGLNETLGKDVFKWVKRREELYSGKHEKKIPDIVFELDGEYGVGMDFFTSYVTPNYTHKKISGGHKPEAVLLTDSNNAKLKEIKRPDSIVGLCDYILKIVNT